MHPNLENLGLYLDEFGSSGVRPTKDPLASEDLEEIIAVLGGKHQQAPRGGHRTSCPARTPWT